MLPRRRTIQSSLVFPDNFAQNVVCNPSAFMASVMLDGEGGYFAWGTCANS